MLSDQFKNLLYDPLLFTSAGSKLKLRSYQEQAALSIIHAVINQTGHSFVVMFPRQSGKNELQAQIEVFLLLLFAQYCFDIVKFSPTWKPQSINAMSRLERVLSKNIITSQNLWHKESGYIYRVGNCRISFFSGEPHAHSVGATSSLLLEVDEAQDIQINKYDKEIAPMAASTNAVKVFWGTSWTSQSLLARELRSALMAEKSDGIRRVFHISADDVIPEVPAYGRHVAEQISKLGRNHPMIRTQYFSEEIDAQAGMFPPARRDLMLGSHARQDIPTPGSIYAACIDVAGEDEAKLAGSDGFSNPGRDSTALTIFEIDLSTLSDLGAPTYRAVYRRQWTGEKHTKVYGQLRSLIESWNIRHVVVDATGVGEGLFSLLNNAFMDICIPVKFTSTEKSELGWKFLAVIETGRYHDHAPFDQDFNHQLDYCRSEILPGPGKTMRWGVPDGTRDENGLLVHDDLVISAALVSKLDDLEWLISSPSLAVKVPDPLDDMDRSF